MMRILKKSFWVISIFAISTMIYAADTPAKEDFTPSVPEGILPADQTPPVINIGKPVAATPDTDEVEES